MRLIAGLEFVDGYGIMPTVLISNIAMLEKPLTKNEIISNIVAATELQKKDVVAIFDALYDEIKKKVSVRKEQKRSSCPDSSKLISSRLKHSPPKRVSKTHLRANSTTAPLNPHIRRYASGLSKHSKNWYSIGGL